MENPAYLGDGLYVSYDGWQFRLYTEREHGVHEVYLDRYMLADFMEFINQASKPPEPK
jgi:hypothetical protein